MPEQEHLPMRMRDRVVGWTVLIVIAASFIVPWLSDIRNETKLTLCHQAAAYKKYSEVRQECATAGSFKTCMRVKMGDDANWISGDVEGGTALPLSPQTPNSVDCFFRTLFVG